ncbi:MAG: hypothetical protein ABIV50_14190 [Opitutus sp.]
MPPSPTFDGKTEQDVREIIIRPLLNELGYTNDMIRTELLLRYPRLYIGRKKPKKDPDLRGAADYIVTVDGRLRVVVEAKKPGSIALDDQEQAYSYAMHPEVRAIFFVLISGTDFEIWYTQEAVESGRLLAFTYDQLEQNKMIIKSILSPDSMRQQFKEYVVDLGIPLGNGLRSTAKVENGWMVYTQVPETIANVLDLKIHFEMGSITRTESGKILLMLKPSHHRPALSAFQNLVAKWIELVAESPQLSSDPNAPTSFTNEIEISVPAGSEVPDMNSDGRTTNRSAVDVTVNSSLELRGYLVGSKFVGKLVCFAYPVGVPPIEVRTYMELVLS